jgi:UDP-N-acetylglucosamine--N-acetylmuramyl-(pentapeptide) pyrophosphoryl-undecaprenol N-acetylglucosamine transferase
MLSSPVPQPPTLCVAAGKSGGHLIPALQLAKFWYQKHPNGKVVLCTYGTMLDQKIYKQYPFISQVQSFAFTTFIAGKLWRYPIITYQAITACVQAWRLLKKTKPQKIITSGGFVALPVSIAAKLLGIPVEVYELNVRPGKAVKALALLGARVFAVFSETLKVIPQAILIDYPVRFTSADLRSQVAARNELTKQIASRLPLHPGRPTLFIIGGSQGSQYLNNLVLKLLAAKPELYSQIQIIHQTGNEPKQYSDHYTQLGIAHLVFDFHSTIAPCYQAADLVICRAGAGTLFELKYFKRPAIIIPLLAASTSHQEANAHAITAQCPELFSTWTQAAIDANYQEFFDTVVKQLAY